MHLPLHTTLRSAALPAQLHTPPVRVKPMPSMQTRLPCSPQVETALKLCNLHRLQLPPFISQVCLHAHLHAHLHGLLKSDLLEAPAVYQPLGTLVGSEN